MFNSALGIICDEHRSLAAVVQGLRHLVGEYRRDAMEPDFKLLRSIVFYLDEFPQKLHHPKEEIYLFAKLQERTRTADKVIAELQRQHLAGLRYVEDLHETLAKYEIDGPAGLAGFSDSVEIFAIDILRHMALEESALLPLASRHLTGEDWVEIGLAFGKNGDPRFVADADHAYAELFRRLINVAWPSGAENCTGSKPGNGVAPDPGSF
jgi:hemerythrin-like domain-containing protein